MSLAQLNILNDEQLQPGRLSLGSNKQTLCIPFEFEVVLQLCPPLGCSRLCFLCRRSLRSFRVFWWMWSFTGYRRQNMSTVKAQSGLAFLQHEDFQWRSLPAVQPLEPLSDKLFETSVFRHAVSLSDAIFLEVLSLGSKLTLSGPFSDFVLKNNDRFRV